MNQISFIRLCFYFDVFFEMYQPKVVNKLLHTSEYQDFFVNIFLLKSINVRFFLLFNV